MPEWYVQVALDVAHPYITELAHQLAAFFFIGFIPGIVSLMFAGPETYS